MKKGCGDQKERLASWMSFLAGGGQCWGCCKVRGDAYMFGLLQRPYCWRAKSYAKEAGARYLAVLRETPMAVVTGSCDAGCGTTMIG